ncbi:MAG TPA: SagB/ThcOx family dehydrogenase [Desulfobaccales bacterium]
MLSIWGVLMVMMGILLNPPAGQGAEAVKLPPPSHKGAVSVAEALKARRTVRHFASRPLALAQVGQILWAADGLSDPRGLRTAASAGATYPLELYLVVGERGVTNLDPGVYRYLVAEHALTPTVRGDQRAPVARASLHQSWMAQAPVMVIIAADYRRCTARYGDRGVMYTHMESGHVGQNVFLMAEALGLGAGIVGAFEDRGLSQVLQLPQGQVPLLVMPVGYKH